MGPFLVAFAAILWATDTLFRYPLIKGGIDPTFIVFFDHLVSVVLLTPFMLLRFRRELTKVSRFQWFGLFFLGGGASAIATVLFTASFKYVNPSVAILLQKLQPIFVILLASLFLGERPTRAFWIWGPLALLAGIAISFPDFNFRFLAEASLASTGCLYALSAAGLWAIATVIGRGILSKLPPMVVTFWRLAFGLLVLAFMLGSRTLTSFDGLGNPETLRALLYIALIPGLLAIILYYQGMGRTTATKTTFMELFFPVTAVTLNTIVLKTPLSPVQITAALVLLFAITRITIADRK
jgi:DME family drug/metabolite transporter